MTLPSVSIRRPDAKLFVLGAVLVASAIVGGGLAVAGNEVPVVGSLARQVLLGAFGGLVLAASAVTARKRTPAGSQEHEEEDVEREAERRRAGVRAVRGLEVDAPLAELPSGVFGFTVPWGVERLREPEGPLGLQPSARGTARLEVHKPGDGDLRIVVYASQETAMAIATTRGAVRVTVFPQRWAEATSLVSIPISRIVSAEHRSFQPAPGDDAYVLRLQLAAA